MPHAEVVLMGGALALAAFLAGRARGTRQAPRLLGAAIVGSAGALLTLGLRPHWSRPPDPRHAIELPQPSTANGYVSSDRCEACHPGNYDSWHRSYHRTMTQLATPDTVVADFVGAGDGVHLSWRGTEVRVFRRGAEFFADVPATPWELQQPPHAARRVKRVVMITGSHHQQAYWTTGEFDGDLRLLTFQWLIDQERWIPREAAFVAPPGSFDGKFWRWNTICIQCHSTAGRTVRDLKKLRLDTDVAELGISCEACHGPADEHVARYRDPLARYSSHLRAVPSEEIVQPERLDALASSQVCGSCHSVSTFHDADWLANGQAFRPGDDLEESKRVLRPGRNQADRVIDGRGTLDSFWNDGMVRVSGREYNGLIDSACFASGELSCLSCHSMHGGDPDDQLAPGRTGDASCIQCHEEIGAIIAAHTHHPAESSGARCLNCHMPHTTYGLLKGIRSHLIDSPRVADTLATGRPIACNQCHLDRTLAWTAARLNEWYGHELPELTEDQEKVSATVLWLLQGDAGARALAAWTLGWDAALDTSGREWAPAFLAILLEDPYSAVRLVAERSLARHPGYERTEVALEEDPRQRSQARRDLLERWSSNRASTAARPELLLGPDGRVDEQAVDRHGARRDDTPLFLAE